MIPRSRFPVFTPARGKKERTLTVPTSGGIHAGIPPQELPLGFSPACVNFVTDLAGSITPRPALSLEGAHNFGGAVLGAAEIFDVQGRSVTFAPSSVSLSVFNPETDGWRYLSYVPGTVASDMTDGPVSGRSSDYFRTVSVYDQNINQNIAVVSNGTNAVKFFAVTSDATTYSDFTFPHSLDSLVKARDVTAVNDRLVFVNTERSDGARFPTRVFWSARGDPRNYDINSEAGFEDVMEMRGEIQAAIRFRDFLLIFTEHEVWRATPTFDAYAFRFDRVIDNVGCPWPKTAVVTPLGVIFLGSDLEVYITDGSSVFPLGPVEVGTPSRIQSILRARGTALARTWAMYNRGENRYELYYATDVSDAAFALGLATDYPCCALYFHLASRSWWPQTFATPLSSGVDSDDADVALTWDEVGVTFDASGLEWDDFTYRVKTRTPRAFSSAGSSFYFSSAATSDDGSVINARWRSPGFRLGGSRKMHLSEVWIDYETDVTSNVSLSVGNSRDVSSFATGVTRTLSTPGGTTHVPTWTVETAPAFEVRVADGGRPRITSFQATLKDGSKF